MSELRELYQETIIDHGRNPRNFGAMTDANCHHEGYNPLCGDKIIMYVLAEDDIIKKIKFEGCGCAISVASASLMTEAMQNKSLKEFDEMFDAFHQLLTNQSNLTIALGKLKVLAGVSEFPGRVKCATLAWHTLKTALEKKS